MSKFFDRVSRDLGRLAEEHSAQLSTFSDEHFYHEYGLICEEIRDDGYVLGANITSITYNKKDVPLEKIKSDWQQFMEHVETLQALHVEFLRRYFERKRLQGGTKNATV